VAVLSYTYNFYNNTLIDSYITKAFQRCGILGPDITGLMADSAVFDLNLMFSEWANKGLNLFTVEKKMFNLNQGQSSYILDQYTVETTEVTAGLNLQLLGGVAASSAGGNAAGPFSGNPLTPCTQVAPNGNISYTYPPGSTPCVYYVGIQSFTNTTYSIVIEYTIDGVLWNLALEIPKQLYPANNLLWFVLPAQLNVSGIRIRETGGATLNIAIINISQPTYSRILSPISRAEYTSYPNKTNQAVPSSFYLDRQETPIMVLWPTPDPTYQTIVYNASQQIMDVNALAQNPNIPQRFMEAAIAGLSARMALIFAADKFPLLDSLSQRAFDLAAREDVENVPMRITPNIFYT
jgi:hypothetical protein